ncbi:hypothetical protein LUZ61_013653 [Rhynchospora tenuis]|uniref:Aquaporin n=1 Tax=Rhynchospora tenuis TaxID=198213 RepID=A0AAD5Z2U3_9POAL|nr:hypothetical protein LUZ61_013653 [Rhynchospora tenuis]
MMCNGSESMYNRYIRLLPDPGVSVLKMVTSEFIGTFIMIFGAAATPIVDAKYPNSETLIGKAGSASIAVAVVILSTGHISGAHINPAVTIALSLFRHFPFVYVPLYIAAQLLGSICASFALKFVFNPFHNGGLTVPTISTGRAFFLEFLITFILLFVITSLAFDIKANRKLTGIAIGGTVFLNILIAGPSTGGSMNPVRTLGPAIAKGNYEKIWIYFLAPVTGAIAGTGAYDFLKL